MVAVLVEEETEIDIICIEKIERNTQVIEMDITKAQVWTETIIITEKETYLLASSAMTKIKYAIANTKRVIQVIERGVEVITKKEEGEDDEEVKMTTIINVIESIPVRMDLLPHVMILMVTLKVAKVQ